MAAQNDGSGAGTGTTNEGAWESNAAPRGRSLRLDLATVNSTQEMIFRLDRVLRLASNVPAAEYAAAKGKANDIDDFMIKIMEDVANRFKPKGDRVTGDNVKVRSLEEVWLDETLNKLRQADLWVSQSMTLRRAELADDYDWLITYFKARMDADPNDAQAREAYEILRQARADMLAQRHQSRTDNQKTAQQHGDAIALLQAELADERKRRIELETLLSQRPAQPTPTVAPGTKGTKGSGTKTTKTTPSVTPGRRKTPRQ